MSLETPALKMLKEYYMSQYGALVASFPGLQPQLMPGNEATAQVKRIHYKWARPHKAHGHAPHARFVIAHAVTVQP